MLTCEHGGFEELDKLVNLDKHIDRHFEVRTGVVSMDSTDKSTLYGNRTIFEEGGMPAHTLEPRGKVRTWQPHYDTRI